MYIIQRKSTPVVVFIFPVDAIFYIAVVIVIIVIA